MILWIIALNSLMGIIQFGFWIEGGFLSFLNLISALIHLSVLLYGVLVIRKAKQAGRL